MIMMRHILKRIIIGVALLLSVASARAQFLDSTTGLLQMPTAVMNREGTFMITNNFINQHALSPRRWGYNTFGYGFDVALWDRLEVAYMCVLLHGTTYYPEQPTTPVNWVNQDRHLSTKLLLIKTGDFGLEWLPNIAFGASDLSLNMFKNLPGNSFFTRLYAVASRRVCTNWGELGGHVGYQWSPRRDWIINAPCAGINWKPIWIQDNWFSLDLIAEYDSRTFNIGFIASLWDDHIDVMFDLQALRWVSFGLRCKMQLKD